MTNFEKTMQEVAKVLVTDKDENLGVAICNLIGKCELCPIRHKCRTELDIDAWLRQETETLPEPEYNPSWA